MGCYMGNLSCNYNATFVATQVARKIAPCNMALIKGKKPHELKRKPSTLLEAVGGGGVSRIFG